MVDNIVQARFLFGRSAKTRPLWQWDYGIILQFDGLDLPPIYTVHFANQPQSGNALQQVGGIGGVVVPDALLETGLNVYAWVYLHTGEDDGETVYSVMIPVNKRPKPTNETPTPAQQSAIDEAIIALNEGVSAAEAAAALLEHPSAHAETLPAGSAATASYADGTFSFGIPRGPAGADGQNGADGQDGFSPTATVTQTESGATVTVTDRNGTTTANLTNGRDGANGQDGTPGVGVPSGGTQGQVLAKASGTNYDTEWVTPYTGPKTVNVSGSTPSITGVADTRYICGEVSTLDITTPASGIVDITFTSGSTPTVLTVTPPTGVTLKWANGFDPTSLDADTTYEINIADGLGVAASWT